MSAKTYEEVDRKHMSAPMTEAEVTARHGLLWNSTQRYGIEQGVDACNKPKYRCIDNHADNDNNDAAERRQKVPMASLSTLLLMVRSLFLAIPSSFRHSPDWKVMGASEDLQAAYRQCPLLSSQVCIAITAVFHPGLGLRYHEMWGQPFGAGHAVPNFYRMAEWLARLVRRSLLIVSEHFFDDFWIVEPKATIASAVWAFNRLLSLLGFVVDPGKSQLPSSLWHALGVILDMKGLVSSSKMTVCPKPRRLYNTALIIVQAINEDRLTPTQAAKLFGKLDFLNTTFFGRVGRLGLALLKGRQYAHCTDGRWHLGSRLREALLWCLELLLLAPPRELSVQSQSQRPCILYTDGSSDPGRSPMHYVGAVLFDPLLPHPIYTHCSVPEEVVSAWLPSGQQIHLVELFGGPLALDTFAEHLRGRLFIQFVDNSAALGSLVKRYSPTSNMLHLVGDYWLRCASLRCFPYLDRVESKSNCSDEPSRPDLDNTLMAQLGAVFVEPCLSYISGHSARDRPCRWLGNEHRRSEILRVLSALNPPVPPST